MPVNFNREVLASINFEPDSEDSDSSEDSVENASQLRQRHGDLPSTRTPTAGVHAVNSPADEGYRPPPPPRKQVASAQNEATRNTIACMKIALMKSISSISRPEKERPLDPRKDFTIESTLSFEKEESGMECCGSGATRVKRSNPFRRATRDAPWYATDDDAANSYAADRQRTNGGQQANRASANTNGNTSTGSSDLSSSINTIEMDDFDDDEDNMQGSPPVSFRFTDYSPMCYRQIREFFGVDPKEYQDVLCRSRWHSIPTPGKSAAQLFFCGQNWVIKTMTNQESDFLRDILHRYYYHVRDNPFTLLPHFVGHHRLEIGRDTMNIIIMQNVFATTNTIHEKYDLKGSTVGRFATQKEKMKHTCTQKDLDINHPVHIGPERRALLIEQIRKDCDFLKRSMIMDYSFLVGIHILPKRTAVAHQQQQHNMGSALHSGLYRPTQSIGGTTNSPGPHTIAAHLQQQQQLQSPHALGNSFHASYSAPPGMTVVSNTSVYNYITSPSFAETLDVSAGVMLGSGANMATGSGVMGDRGAFSPRGEATHMDPAAGGASGSFSAHAQAQEPRPLDGSCFIADDGGMLSTDEPLLRQEIYYVGIIDILQEYNFRKRAETLFVGLAEDRDRISSIHPYDYAKRFVAFMSSIVV